MQTIALANLVKIEFPDTTIVRWSEGAELKWGAEVYRPRHATYGAIASAETMAEGIGNEVPAMQLTLHPPSTAAAADLVQPGAQKAQVRAWTVRYNPDTATVLDAPSVTPLFFGFLDQARLVRGPGKFELVTSVVSQLEYLFARNAGNWLSPTFHKFVWPGETGEDQATGLVLQDAWGVEAPPQQVSYGTGGIYGGQTDWYNRVAKR